MHFFAGVVAAVACGLFAWAAARVQTKWLAIGAVPFLIVIVAGMAFNLLLYRISDEVVAAFGLLAGVTLGRLMPPRFGPFLILLLVLSALDVAKNLWFFAWSIGIWTNVAFGRPAGFLTIAVAVVILITATSESLRRRGVTVALSLLPGVIGISLGEALLSTLPFVEQDYIGAIATSQVLFLTAGYALTELAASQQKSAEA